MPLLIGLAVIVISLTFHEAAHAWSADRLGDPTARFQGRLSLNPLVHIDPIGTVLLPLVAFATGAPLIGWARPVPVDLRNLRHGRRDFMFIALAGPVSNLLIAIAASLLTVLFVGRAGDPITPGAAQLAGFLDLAFKLNLMLAVFNMIPVPPLDGGNVLAGLLPPGPAQAFDRLRPFGIFILYGLLLTGTLWTIIRPPYLFLARLLTL